MAGRVGGLPDHVVAALVVVVVAVAHVQPGHVHAGLDELADLISWVDGGGPRVHTILALRTRPSLADRVGSSSGA